jgi:hypothetical protein
MARRDALHAVALAAVRAAYAVILFGVLGGIGLATAVLSSAGDGPTTVAAALRIDGDPGLDRRRAEAVAVLIADCMQERGLPWAAVPEPAPQLPDPELDPVAWASRWGFGLSTMVGSASPEATADANMTAIDGSDPSTRAAYLRALHGQDGTPGCHEIATDAVFGSRDRLLAPLRADLDTLDAQIAADPVTQRAVGAWRTCVGPITAGLAADRRSLPGALLGRFDARVRNLAGARSIAGLAAVQADERRVATVVAECELAYASARAGAAAVHEAAFVAKHGEALTTIGAALRAAEAALPTLAPDAP